MYQCRQVPVRLRAGDPYAGWHAHEFDGARQAGLVVLGCPAAQPARRGIRRARRRGDHGRAWTGAAGGEFDHLQRQAAPRSGVKRWFDAGVQGRAIHVALKREHVFAGSYSAVVCMLGQLRGERPADVTVLLGFAPAEVSQVDFGAPHVVFIFMPHPFDARESADIGIHAHTH